MTYEEIIWHVGIMGWPLWIAFTIFLNWYRVTKRKLKPHYLSTTYSRVFAGFIFMVMINQDFDPANRFFYQMWKAAPAIMYIWCSFYVFFDAGLNWLRGKRWNYKGKSSGILDRSKILLYYAIKILCLIGLIYSTYILLI